MARHSANSRPAESLNNQGNQDTAVNLDTEKQCKKHLMWLNA